MHVFGSDGTLKRRMMPYKYNRNYQHAVDKQILTKSLIYYDDKIYTSDSRLIDGTVKVFLKTGQCLQVKNEYWIPKYGSYPSRI